MAGLSTCYMTRMFGRLAALGLVAAACCSKSEVKDAGSGAASLPAKPAFTLFALAEMRGQIGPCGCTSDPLGDISRTTKLVSDARAKGPVLVVDAGSLLYSENPVPPHLEAQEELKADLLSSIYQRDLKVSAVGLGPADLAKGAKGERFARYETNIGDPDYATLPPSITQVGEAKVGVFGVIANDAVSVKTSDPVAAGKTAVTQLRKDGAQLVIALVQASNKKAAVKLVRDIGGIDVAVAGLGLAAPEPNEVEIEPTKIGDGWLVIPGNRGQVVSRLDVTLRGPASPLADAVGPAAAAAKAAQLDKRIAALDAELAKFATDKDADPKFIAAKQAERTQLVTDRDHLKSHPLVAPARGSFFTLEQIRINKKLACSLPVQDAVKAYDLAAGEANVKAAAGKPIAPVARGQASYVGMEACADCHSEQNEFWNKTVHAGAWKTLVDRGQQFDFSCIGCHVTGWEKPGGSNLAHNDNLRDVQCETCHGPGSIHVARGGEEKPPAVRRNPPADLCATQCHTKEHSDTFQYEAYLRDIVGPGHGGDLRKKLGAGPTGHELRKAALDKAGTTLGQGCTR
ncbi:MAG: hypothetical protein JWO36_3668 [Myxococcales bacterium]|nr:hypothetical protein [Myxococcales bacterium]